jgi:hypothetical protein
MGQLEAANASLDRATEAPRSWPKSSLSTRPTGSAAQLTLIKGFSARALLECRALAISSLPVPLSPVIKTVASVGATRATFAMT